jgi:hypothetical protein
METEKRGRSQLPFPLSKRFMREPAYATDRMCMTGYAREADGACNGLKQKAIVMKQTFCQAAYAPLLMQRTPVLY